MVKQVLRLSILHIHCVFSDIDSENETDRATDSENEIDSDNET